MFLGYYYSFRLVGCCRIFNLQSFRTYQDEFRYVAAAIIVISLHFRWGDPHRILTVNFRCRQGIQTTCP